MAVRETSDSSAIRLKRIYQSCDSQDGLRVFVDRLWARGMSKDRADLDAWMKELGPSTELREWFGHRAERWPDFQARYRRELSAPLRRLFLDLLQSAAQKSVVTLVYGAHDTQQNAAVVLREYLLGYDVIRARGRDDPLVLLAVVGAVAAAQPAGEASVSCLVPFVEELFSGPRLETALKTLRDRGQLREEPGGWRLAAQGQRLLRDVPSEPAQ